MGADPKSQNEKVRAPSTDRENPVAPNMRHEELKSALTEYVRDYLMTPQAKSIIRRCRFDQSLEVKDIHDREQDILTSEELTVTIRGEGAEYSKTEDVEPCCTPGGCENQLNLSQAINWDYQIGVGAIKVFDVVKLSDTSVRLHNCITRADDSELLSKRTVREYLDAITQSEQEFLRITSFGRKSVSELTDLVKAWERAAAAASNSEHFCSLLNISHEELLHLIDFAKFDKDEVRKISSSIPQENSAARLSKVFEGVRFPQCITAGNASVRLRNTLVLFERNNWLECSSLASFLKKRDYWLLQLERQKNFGRKTRNELLMHLEQVVASLLARAGMTRPRELAVWLIRSTDDHPPLALTDKHWELIEGFRQNYGQFEKSAIAEVSVDEVVAEIADKPESGMRKFLQEHLQERDFDILNRRYGIDRTRCQTLSEIATGYGLTRERIRQIEVRAIKRCRSVAYRSIFQEFLETQQSEIISAVADEGPFVSTDDTASWKRAVTGLERIALIVLHKDFESWLNANLEVVVRDGQRLGWFVPHIDPAKRQELERWFEEGTPDSSSLRWRVRTALYEAHWPVSIVSLRAKLPDVPEARLISCLTTDFDADVESGLITSIRRLPSSIRLVLVLREAGRSLHLSEVRARHNKMFGVDIREHAAGAVLQRLEQALIVERGTYDLYENLSLDSDAVQRVRNACVGLLEEKNHFLSAKILHRHLREYLPSELHAYLTPYMVLGICQDDPHFATRRGLMVGLAQEGFEATFTSLTETVHDVVRKHGPVTVADIRKHISEERQVLDATINMILQSSPEIVMPERARYDLLDRVIGDETQTERLTQAIQLALIDRPASLPILTSRLHAIGFELNAATIVSFLRNAGFVNRIGQLFELTVPDHLTLEYNLKFHEIFDTSQDQSANQTALSRALSGHEQQSFIPLDFRLAMAPSTWECVEEGFSNESDLLEDLMSEFEF